MQEKWNSIISSGAMETKNERNVKTTLLKMIQKRERERDIEKQFHVIWTFAQGTCFGRTQGLLWRKKYFIYKLCIELNIWPHACMGGRPA